MHLGSRGIHLKAGGGHDSTAVLTRTPVTDSIVQDQGSPTPTHDTNSPWKKQHLSLCVEETPVSQGNLSHALSRAASTPRASSVALASVALADGAGSHKF